MTYAKDITNRDVLLHENQYILVIDVIKDDKKVKILGNAKGKSIIVYLAANQEVETV